ncbi:MAG: phage tail assembly chaperone [Pelagibacterium sp.]|uniref:rcc01693 family protein n=1 Tax=Pelagibacterium sp. TaxID=1967288 RepID=UPI0032EFF396
MSGFPWSDAMAFGLGVLRLAPGTFWAMTPRELAAAHNGVAGRKGAALGRYDLEALMALHPDGEGR